MIKQYLKNNQGMTLIECVIAMMIASIIMMAGVVTFLNFYENYYDTQEKNLQATVMDGVTEMLSEELRYATSLRIRDNYYYLQDEDADMDNGNYGDIPSTYTDLEKIMWTEEGGVVFYSGTSLADTTSLANVASDQTVSLTFCYYPDDETEAAAEANGMIDATYVLYIDIKVESTTSDNYLEEQIAIKMVNMELLGKGIDTSRVPSTGNILYYTKTVQE